ncbi:hypothetical protein T492DRAFT_887006 [Pavlovales sp. CCMP2436]|nr:hypothetical protein T492DRAFT_887006 [Pavlovales sp. CCMP2436]
MYNIGNAYYTGEISGIAQDHAKARTVWLRAATDFGPTASISMLAEQCFKAEGVEKDVEAAVGWLQLAAQQQLSHLLTERLRGL